MEQTGERQRTKKMKWRKKKGKRWELSQHTPIFTPMFV
jgi:hypothetical protein